MSTSLLSLSSDELHNSLSCLLADGREKTKTEYEQLLSMQTSGCGFGRGVRLPVGLGFTSCEEGSISHPVSETTGERFARKSMHRGVPKNKLTLSCSVLWKSNQQRQFTELDV